jgi:hypothetical protein
MGVFAELCIVGAVAVRVGDALQVSQDRAEFSLPQGGGPAGNGWAVWFECGSRRLFFSFSEMGVDKRSECGQDEVLRLIRHLDEEVDESK